MKKIPESIESENYILGICLTYKNTIIKIIENNINENWFYNNNNRLIFNAILEINKQGNQIDLLSVSNHIRQTNNSFKSSIIVELTKNVGTDNNLNTHIDILKNKYIKREAIQSALIIENESYTNNNINDILTIVNKNTDKLNEINAGNEKALSLDALLEDSIQRAEKRAEYYSKHKTIEGIKTGLKNLDNVIYGLQNNKLIILGGRPGSGKTAFALKLAKEANKEVVFFSLEMDKKELSDRLILSNTDINPDNYTKGNLETEQWLELDNSIEKLKEKKIHIEDNALMNIDKIKAKSMMYKNKGKCDIIIIDYLQLIDMKTENKQYNKTNEIGELSRKCKLLAKELKVPVILLSQLNRDVEKRPNKRPYLSDLRESGSIEQDADIVMFCYRPAYYDIIKDEEGIDYPNNYFELIVAKNRGGITGSVKLIHKTGLTNFYEYNGEQPFDSNSDSFIESNHKVDALDTIQNEF